MAKLYYKDDNVAIIHGDCIEVMSKLKRPFDACITDPPYGTTRNKWDSVIPFEDMWSSVYSCVKADGAICLFGQDKFTAKCMLSSEFHRYNLVWKKGNRTSGFLNANRMPLRNHEDIMVFYKKLPTYNPQMTEGSPLHGKGVTYKTKCNTNNNYGEFQQLDDVRKGATQKYPKSVIDFDRPHPPIHPTQKPVELIEYLIKTYTNEGERVLDFTCGSGTTLIAGLNTGRKVVGIEMDEKYCEIAKQRVLHWYEEHN